MESFIEKIREIVCHDCYDDFCKRSEKSLLECIERAVIVFNEQ